MNTVTRRWWMMDVRGMASFAFGVLLLLGPGWGSSRWLAAAFGVFAVVDATGTLAFVLAARGFDTTAYAGRVAVGLIAGAAALAHPSATMPALFVLVSLWGFGTGVLELVFGSRAWTTVPKPVAFMLQGMVSLGLGTTAIHFALESPAMLRGLLVVYAIAGGIAATLLCESLHACPRPAPQAL